MKTLALLLTGFAILISTIGCGVEQVKDFDLALEKGTEFELFSLDPSMMDKNERETFLKANPNGLFQNWKIIGSTKITDNSVRNSLLKALVKAKAENDRVAACFNPRHGIRVAYKGKTYEYAICFECYQIYQYIDGQRGKSIKTTSTPSKVFNNVLTDAKVGLPKN